MNYFFLKQCIDGDSSEVKFGIVQGRVLIFRVIIIAPLIRIIVQTDPTAKRTASNKLSFPQSCLNLHSASCCSSTSGIPTSLNSSRPIFT